MHLFYLKNREKQSAEYSNQDVEIITSVNNHRTTISVVAKKDIVLEKAKDVLPFHVNYSDQYFLNGYQSWTDTKEFALATRLRNIKKSPHIISHMFAMDRYGDSTFYDYSIRKMHGYDIFYSKGKHESFIFNMNYKNAYLIIELIKDRRSLFITSDIKGIVLKKGESITIFDYYLYYNFSEGLQAFNQTFKEKPVEKLFGYTSWYNYYQNINEDIILRDLEALDNKFNIFQIDDGYETFVGDWLDVDKNKFPNGLSPIIEKIHQKGLKAGLWLAPFVAEEKSKLFREHLDWIKKDSHGHPMKSGGNWSGHYALDLDNKEVIDYIKECLKHYADMGFDFFKLDFLYAAGLPQYKGVSRCQKQYQAYSLLRETLKDKLVLGCGANIMNSYENFDYLRVGPDVSLEFDDVAYMRLFHRERISTKVTVQNTIYRSFFNNHLFGNDPDVFLLRSDNIKLSLPQRKALIKINALFGSVFMTSDNIATYNKEQKQILSEALEIFEKGVVDSYVSKNHKIKVEYHIGEQMHQFVYDTKKGVLTNDR